MVDHATPETRHLTPETCSRRPAFRLLHPLAIPVKAVAAGRAAIDTLQPIRPVPLIRRRSRRRHIAGIVVGEVNRGGSVVIAVRTVVDGRVARLDFRERHPIGFVAEVIKPSSRFESDVPQRYILAKR